MATLCAYLKAGYSLQSASRIAIEAGTLQFHKADIAAITMSELTPYI
jgi:hypothetical protein